MGLPKEYIKNTENIFDLELENELLKYAKNLPNQFSKECLKNISFCGENWLLYPLDPKYKTEINSWRNDYQLRIEFCHRLLQALSQKQTSANFRIVELLKKLEKNANKIRLPSTIHYYYVWKCKNNFQLSNCLIEILPYIVFGLPIAIISNNNNHTADIVNLIENLFVKFGAPRFIINYFIDANLSSEHRIAVYLLTETADVESTLDNISDTYSWSNISCFKILLQESFKKKIKTLLEQADARHFEKIFSKNSDLFLNFNEDKSGITWHYYRDWSEAISTINTLIGPKRPHLVSIWTDETGLAIKMARAIKNVENISINCSNTGPNLNSIDLQWPLQLMVYGNYSAFINNRNLKLQTPNNSWKSLNNQRRQEILFEMLNNDNRKIMPTEVQSIRMLLYMDSGHCFEEDLSVENILHLKYKAPYKVNIMVNLANKDVINSSLMIFLFKVLLDGNVITLFGTNIKGIVERWRPILMHLNANKNSENILQMIEIADNIHQYNDLQLKNEGVAILIDEMGQTQSLYIDQNHFDDHNSSDFLLSIYQWLARANPTISIALQDFEMKNIVEK